MPTGAEIARAALLEVAAIDPIDPTPQELLTLALDQATRTIDTWNADHGASFVELFVSYTLTPSLNPHTIGPTGTFTVTQRPVSIETANLVLSTPTPASRSPINIVSAAQYADISVRGVTSDIPLALYYAADWPNGSIYLWPIPTAAYALELWTRTVLAGLTAAGSVSLPPGYQEALILTVAEALCAPLGLPTPPQLPGLAGKARARVWGNNVVVPKLRTVDSGMPSSGRGGAFNYLTGTGGGR